MVLIARAEAPDGDAEEQEPVGIETSRLRRDGARFGRGDLAPVIDGQVPEQALGVLLDVVGQAELLARHFQLGRAGPGSLVQPLLVLLVVHQHGQGGELTGHLLFAVAQGGLGGLEGQRAGTQVGAHHVGGQRQPHGHGGTHGHHGQQDQRHHHDDALLRGGCPAPPGGRCHRRALHGGMAHGAFLQDSTEFHWATPTLLRMATVVVKA